MCEYSIRPHHLLCIQFFEGKGYNDDFVKHMAEIHSRLINHNPKIHLVKGTDDICSKCPNNENGQCNKEPSVSGNDKRTYQAIKDEIKGDETWEELTELVYKNIIEQNKLKHVCQTCRWSNICMNINKK